MQWMSRPDSDGFWFRRCPNGTLTPCEFRNSHQWVPFEEGYRWFKIPEPPAALDAGQQLAHAVLAGDRTAALALAELLLQSRGPGE